MINCPFICFHIYIQERTKNIRTIDHENKEVATKRKNRIWKTYKTYINESLLKFLKYKVKMNGQKQDMNSRIRKRPIMKRKVMCMEKRERKHLNSIQLGHN